MGDCDKLTSPIFMWQSLVKFLRKSPVMSLFNSFIFRGIRHLLESLLFQNIVALLRDRISIDQVICRFVDVVLYVPCDLHYINRAQLATCVLAQRLTGCNAVRTLLAGTFLHPFHPSPITNQSSQHSNHLISTFQLHIIIRYCKLLQYIMRTGYRKELLICIHPRL